MKEYSFSYDFTLFIYGKRDVKLADWILKITMKNTKVKKENAKNVQEYYKQYYNRSAASENLPDVHEYYKLHINKNNESVKFPRPFAMLCVFLAASGAAYFACRFMAEKLDKCLEPKNEKHQKTNR